MGLYCGSKYFWSMVQARWLHLSLGVAMFVVVIIVVSYIRLMGCFLGVYIKIGIDFNCGL